MVSSKGKAKLLSGILEEMHIQSSVEVERKERIECLIVILWVMRLYNPNQYSTATLLFERVHYTLCHEVPQSCPGVILIPWIRNERMAAGTIEPLHFIWVDEHLVTEAGYCSHGYSNYTVERAHDI